MNAMKEIENIPEQRAILKINGRIIKLFET